MLRRNFRQDIVHLLKDEPTTWPQGLNLPANVFTDLIRGTRGQDPMCIATPTPKGEPLPKIPFELFRLHPAAGDLNLQRERQG